MLIRKANFNDAERVLALLSQVLEIHAKIRPDIFIPGSTKYTSDDLYAIFRDETSPVYVAEDGGAVVGYAFCRVREPKASRHVIPKKSVMIDDLCVDERYRGQGVGEALFDHVKNEARRLGCAEIILAVWEGNDRARRFYDKMGMKPKETIMEYPL